MHENDRVDLVSDCSRCVGLCCVVLPFGRSADFAFDKRAGEPCRHLTPGHACGIHAELRPRGMTGCTVFECFGAGQQVTQVVYADRPAGPDGTDPEVIAVFDVVRGLHEMLVLLEEAGRLGGEVARLRERLADLVGSDPATLLAVDTDALRREVGPALAAVSGAVRRGGPSLAGADLVGADLRRRGLRDADLRGALLIGADLRDADLGRADLLGADLRGADLSGADLSDVLFLTTPQAAGARGDASTRIPDRVARPAHWR
ncbi:pentapeptide repeat-containing protein [Nocardioides dongkuii]|uniref:pentapeptide repeat-containing protein n=1 Tax=Nocardioides dongkuii TaxID=2760089 RepID=UPI0015FC1207|nr:pentapeptide repeat-containing protein [Nocardioides dongkuii]